jgi:signal transduction histidine kinase
MLTIEHKIRDHTLNVLPLVRVNSEQRKEALSNVLENATRYTYAAKSQSRITNDSYIPSVIISVVPNPVDLDRGVSIILEDNGPGTLEGEREAIFQQRYRGRKAALVPGCGMGLFNSRVLLSTF